MFTFSSVSRLTLTRMLSFVSILVTIGAVLIVVYHLATDIWFLAVGPSESKLTVTRQFADKTQFDEADVEAIAAANLFGVPVDSDLATTNQTLKETTLNLTLVGTFIGEGSPDEAVAFISQDGRVSPKQDYRVGDPIDSFARIEAIHPRYIVIVRSGERERLTFKEKAVIKELSVAISPNEVGSTDMHDEDIDQQGSQGASLPDPEVIMEELGNFRQVPTTYDYQALLRLGFQETVNNNGAPELVIADSSGANVFTQLGMQPGDVVLSINGVKPDALRSDQATVEAVLKADTAQVELRRGSRQFFMTVPAP